MKKIFFSLIAIYCVGVIRSHAQCTSIITTIAGNVKTGYAGNNGPATAASMYNPYGVCMDAGGNLYISVYSENVIRKVSVSGIITTIGGTGVAGYGGDGGPATDAQIKGPTGIRVDNVGNVYFSDGLNNRVRKISAAGIITTVAGTGVEGFSGNGGPATAATLAVPDDICLDNAGNLYICDGDNAVIRKVNTAGIITTVAGSDPYGAYEDGVQATSSHLFYPVGITVDASNNLYIVDIGLQRVLKVTAATGIIKSIIGNGYDGAEILGDGGPATAAHLDYPYSVLVDGTGRVYVSDGDGRVRRMSTSGIITTIAGGSWGYSGDGGPATDAAIDAQQICLDGSGNLIIADIGNQRVRKVTGGVINTIAGNGSTNYSGNGGPAIDAGLATPLSAGSDASGNYYIGANNGTVRKINTSGLITVFAGTGTTGMSGDGGPATAAQIGGINDIYVDNSGNFFLSDASNNRILKINTAGVISTVAGTGTAGYTGDGGPATAAKLTTPASVRGDNSGNLYISDYGNNVIRKISASGIITTIGGDGTSGFSGDGGPATAAKLNGPADIYRDGSGNIYIADRNNKRVRKINASGTIETIAGTGTTGFAGDGGPATAAQMSFPISVTMDCAGNLYVADILDRRVRRIGTDGIITTIAGTGVAGGAGEGVPATAGQISSANRIRINNDGDMLIADAGVNRIRKVTLCTSSPTISAISGASAICTGGSASLTDSTTGGSWTSGNTSVATVGTSGIVTGVSAGTAVITYTIGSGCGTASATAVVTVNPMPDAGIISGVMAVCAGSSTTLSNTVSGGAWSSDATSVATVDPATGIVTGMTAGTADISYTVTNSCGTASSSVVITVNALPDAGTITGTATVCAGSSITLSSTVSGGVWSAASTGIAIAGSATGIVTGVTGGTATISYTTTNSCGTASASTTVTVNALPNAGTISGASSVTVGSTTALSASVSGGTWSAGSANASVSSSGVVTGVTAGTVTISYTVNNTCGTAVAIKTLNVVTATLGSITGTLSLCAGTTGMLSNTTTGGVWTSANYAVATISSSTGAITAAAAGTARITYTYSGLFTTAIVTVNSLPATISGATSVCPNATITLTDATTGGTWSSSNTALGTVSAAGVVTGITSGTPTITYMLGTGCYRTLNVTVKGLPGGIAGNKGICVGATSMLTDGTGTSWSSSTPSVATIGVLSGVVTGISSGTSIITFNASTGCIATTVVTIDATPTIAAITGPSGVQVGHTITLADATAGGTWSSNNPARATVSSSGVVTAVSVPAVIISYSVANGACVASVTKLISIVAAKEAPTQPSIGEPAKMLTVYPNPTHGAFTVQTSSSGTFTIYTLEGKEIQHMAVVEGVNTVHLPEGIAAGIYMCRFISDDGNSTMVRLVYE